MAPGDPRSAAGFCGGLRDGGSLRSLRVVPAGVSAEGSPQPRRVGGRRALRRLVGAQAQLLSSSLPKRLESRGRGEAGTRRLQSEAPPKGSCCGPGGRAGGGAGRRRAAEPPAPCRAERVPPGTGAGVPGVGIPVLPAFPASLVLVVQGSWANVWRVSVKTPRKKKQEKRKKKK